MARNVIGRGTVGCKHRFVHPIEGDEPKLKCSWCWKRFASSTELIEEYKRLNIPYKIRDPDTPESMRKAIMSSTSPCSKIVKLQ